MDPDNPQHPTQLEAARPPATPGPRWQLRLLGAFALQPVLDSGAAALPQPPDLRSRAAMLLLARLALFPDREHPREELVDMLWPAVALAVGRNRLRQTLSSLRAALGDDGRPETTLLLSARDTLRLRPGVVLCDVHTWRSALSSARQAGSLEPPLHAAALYTGELLPGFVDDWVLDERRHLAALAETGAPATPRQALITPAPSNPLPVYLTRALGIAGVLEQLGQALQQHRLVTLLGPGGAGKTRIAVELLRRLQHDAQHDPAGNGGGAAGPAARPLAPAFERQVFVSLVGCQNRAAMHDALLLALHQEAAGTGPSTTLARLQATLAGADMLLVLDNFEQLAQDAAADIGWLAAQLPGLHLLVTSRRPLGLDGEREISLPPLGLPLAGDDLATLRERPAVALFLDRARAVGRDVQLDEQQAPTVGAIVQHLEGLPLAIELAAARLRGVALAEMLTLLKDSAEQSSGAALALLNRAGPRQAHDTRHASMLGVVEWSLAPLSAAQRGLLTAVAAFHGQATAQAAAAVWAPDASRPGLMLELLPMLDELVACSVLRVQADGDLLRYRCYEPVREVLLFHLPPAQRRTLRSRHRAWVLQRGSALGQCASLAAAREELPDLLAALHSAVADGEPAQAVATALAWESVLVDLPLPPSGITTLQDALQAAALDETTSALAHGLLAEQCFEAGQREAALHHAEQAQQRAHALPPSSDQARASALRAAARVVLRVNDGGSGGAGLAQAWLQESLALARAHARPDQQAQALSLLGVAAFRRERQIQHSMALYEEALLLWQRIGNPRRVTASQVSLAISLGFMRRFPEQLQLLQRIQADAAAQQQWRLLSFAQSVYGYALADSRRYGESALSYRACLRSTWALGAWREWFYALWNLPRTLAHLRQGDAAARLMGFADHFFSQRFGQLGPEDLPERRRTRRLCAVLLGAKHEAACWQEGRALTPAAAMQLAMRVVVD